MYMHVFCLHFFDPTFSAWKSCKIALGLLCIGDAVLMDDWLHYEKNHYADAGVLTPGEEHLDCSKLTTKDKVMSRNSSESSGDEERERRNTTNMGKQVAPVMKIAGRVRLKQTWWAILQRKWFDIVVLASCLVSSPSAHSFTETRLHLSWRKVRRYGTSQWYLLLLNVISIRSQ